jgi:hypothetical protein
MVDISVGDLSIDQAVMLCRKKNCWTLLSRAGDSHRVTAQDDARLYPVVRGGGLVGELLNRPSGTQVQAGFRIGGRHALVSSLVNNRQYPPSSHHLFSPLFTVDSAEREAVLLLSRATTCVSDSLLLLSDIAGGDSKYLAEDYRRFFVQKLSRSFRKVVHPPSTRNFTLIALGKLLRNPLL